MYCMNCGKQIDNDAKFCPYCGKPANHSDEKAEQKMPGNDPVQADKGTPTEITATQEQSPIFSEEVPGQDNAWSAAYQKNKMIGLVVYKRIHTEVNVSEGQVIISQKTGRKAPIETRELLSNLRQITKKSAFDFWDTLYAFIFLTIAIICIFCGQLGGAGGTALLGIICFFSGFGKEVSLRFENGATAHIPLNSGSESESLINNVVHYSNRDVPVSADKKSSRIVFVVFVGLVALGILLGIIRMIGGDEKDDDILNGEYVVVVDDAPDEGYMYLSFDWNGPGTLQMYFSDDIEDVLELQYTISPTDIEGTYLLNVSNEEVGNVELFTFSQLEAEDVFAVDFSDQFTDGMDVKFQMIPLTEEPDSSENSNMIADRNESPSDLGLNGNLPAWCSGDYYGEDIYSTVVFADNSPAFDIFIYRLVDISCRIVNIEDNDCISFVGDFDIDVGSVAGTLTNYGGSDLLMTITESDWEMLPAGTTMFFYYNYPDDNYSNHLNMNSDCTSDICGVYISMDVPANRLFVWENDGNIEISIRNREDSIAIGEVTPYEMEWNSDVLYFSGGTIGGGEEGFTGSYDPSLGVIELYPVDDSSYLSAYGISGMFSKVDVMG